MAKKKATIERPNFSEHTLDVDLHGANTTRFNYADIEAFVEQLVIDDHKFSRRYQVDAIRKVMTYLWGDRYANIQDLARENYPRKSAIRKRFVTEEIFLNHLPLPDRLSGVVHMATGTGKSFVIFAVAYLSLVLGLTKRVLVFGPSSTIIEEGLRDKFRKKMDQRELQEALPMEYRNKPIALLTDNDVFEEQSIVIENINVIFGNRKSAILDFFKNNPDEDVLVLGDEIHHAYSHLDFHTDHLDLDDSKDEERLWMQFLRENVGIKRHIGFTGTPYNADEHFADIIFDYSIKDAVEEQQIKRPNPTKKIITQGGEHELTADAFFKVVIERHNENSQKYSYPDAGGRRRVKPITIFICSKQASAESDAKAFKHALVEHGGMSEIEAEQKVIVVISKADETEYKQQLDAIEVVDPQKVGGLVEYVFAVAKLSEGWDVDNVFQIVPMQDRVFNSKLLISQVLGRGLRLPRKVPRVDLFSFGAQPMVTIANHERFGGVVEELLDQVINTDVHLVSEVILEASGGRGVHHFPLALLHQNPIERQEAVEQAAQQQAMPTELILEPQQDEKVEITFREDRRIYEIPQRLYPINSIVASIDGRFRNREHEASAFPDDHENIVLPGGTEIKEIILRAMQSVAIEGTRLTLDNKKRIELYFNQKLPGSRVRRVFDRIDGSLDTAIHTRNLERRSVRESELNDGTSAFLSDKFEQELSEENRALLAFIKQERANGHHTTDAQAGLLDVDYIQQNSALIWPLVVGDARSPFIVSTERFATPQSIVFTSHDPERRFLFELIEVDGLIRSWIKSPDKGFYSIDYEYWRGGKDRKRAGFNPDFFLYIDLEKYISALDHAGKDEHVKNLRDLLDRGVTRIVHIVEIKSDEDDDPVTEAKEAAAHDYVKRLNGRLRSMNAVDIPLDVREEISHQRYFFRLLRPDGYFGWRTSLQDGSLFQGLVLEEFTSEQ